MKVYTYSEARQQLATLLAQVLQDGEVRIRRRDGQEFAVRPIQAETSPLDVETVKLDITTAEIVDIIRESRASYPSRRRESDAG